MSMKGGKYPPVLFATNITQMDFKQKLEEYEAFSKLDTEAVGLPIGVQILMGHRTKQDGTQFSTLMLSASTLGLIPIVSNTEFKVFYRVYVQGEAVATFKYEMESTDVGMLWTQNQGERKTKPAEELFLEYTLPKFLTELKQDEEVQAVFNEYYEYFGEAA